MAWKMKVITSTKACLRCGRIAMVTKDIEDIGMASDSDEMWDVKCDHCGFEYNNRIYEGGQWSYLYVTFYKRSIKASIVRVPEGLLLVASENEL